MRRDPSRAMTERERAIETILVALDQFFPGMEPVPIKFICAWLALADLPTILQVMEEAHERDQREPLRSVSVFIYSRLNKGEKPKCKDVHSSVIRFDENGQRISI